MPHGMGNISKKKVRRNWPHQANNLDAKTQRGFQRLELSRRLAADWFILNTSGSMAESAGIASVGASTISSLVTGISPEST